MPATTKSALIDVTVKEFAKLEKLLGEVDPAQAMIKDAEDTSIKDVVAHRAHWITLFLGWYADGQAGKEVHFPAPGYKWNDLKRYNADLRARQSDLDWPAAAALLHGNAKALLTFMQERSDAALYGGPMQGARNTWTPGRWAEAAGPSHYRSATRYLRQRLKAM